MAVWKRNFYRIFLPLIFFLHAMGCGGANYRPITAELKSDPWLGYPVTIDGIVYVSKLSREKVLRLHNKLADAKKLLFVFLGKNFEEKLPGASSSLLKITIYEDKLTYQQALKMLGRTGSGDGGMYFEQLGEIVTYDRPAAPGRFSVEDLVTHEYIHFLMATHVFPGSWNDVDYHSITKGWLDEGMAEAFVSAGVQANGTVRIKSRDIHFKKLCQHKLPTIMSITAIQEGYSSPGQFDYSSAWAAIYFLANHHRALLIRLLEILRTGKGHREYDKFVSQLTQLEQDWQSRISAECIRG